MKYTVHFALIPSMEIFNLTSPRYLPEVSRKFDDWWNPKYDTIRDKIEEIYVRRFNEEVGHYSRLEESIKKDGFLNPIFVTCGQPRWRKIEELPPEMQQRKDLLLSEHLGGSRLWVAQKLGLDVPCIVSDFTDRFKEDEELKTPKDIMGKFTNPDCFTQAQFTPKGAHLMTNKFIHIEDEKYNLRQQSRVRGSIIREILQQI